MQLINADAVKQTLIAFATALHTEVLTLDTIIMILNQYEPVDAVQVVRCKDCKRFKTYLCPMWFCNSHDDFCCYGERKEDE